MLNFIFNGLKKSEKIIPSALYKWKTIVYRYEKQVLLHLRTSYMNGFLDSSK